MIDLHRFFQTTKIRKGKKNDNFTYLIMKIQNLPDFIAQNFALENEITFNKHSKG